MTDRRALLLALAAWVGSFGAWWSLSALAVAAAVVVAAAGSLRGGRRGWAALALALAFAAGAGTASIARTAAQPDPEAADAFLSIEARTISAPRQIPAPGLGAARYAVSATVVGYNNGQRAWRSSLPVRVFGPASWAGVPMGSSVAFRGRLTGPKPGSARGVATSVGQVRVVAAPTGAQGPAAAMRSALADALADGADDPASLVAGLAIGDESRQDPAFAEQMQFSGLSHLTAVSGGNVAIVLAAVLIPARLLRVPRWVQAAGAAVVLVGYVVLVGPQPSVVRAAAMGAVGLLGVLLGGAPRGLPVLGSCVLVLVLASPALAVSLGFALSVVATAALITLAPVLVSWAGRVPWLRRVPDMVLLAAAVTVSAQAATAPLLLAIGAPVSWVAVPANLLAAPLVAPITVLGLLAAVCGPVFPAAAGAIGAAALIPGEWLAAVAVTAARYSAWTPAASIGVPAAVALLAAAAMGLRFVARLGGRPPRGGRNGGTRMRARHRRALRVGVWLVAVPLLLLALWVAVRPGGLPADWRVVVCDVGQGTAVLLRDGPDSAVLVDVGPADSPATGCVADAGVRQLSAVVITHFHADHYGGVADVVRRFPVSQIVTTGFALPAEGAAAVAGAARDHGIEVRTVAAGDVIGLMGGSASVLWPPPGFRGVDEDANNSSIVLRARWQDGFTALTTGDIEPESQARLLGSGADLRADLAVMPHHGSDHQHPDFAAATGAAAAVASAGDSNTYGHPAGPTLTEYRRAGASVWRTDRDGSVAVQPLGDALEVSGS